MKDKLIDFLTKRIAKEEIKKQKASEGIIPEITIQYGGKINAFKEILNHVKKNY